MKFEPEHDPDPIRRKFRNLSSIFDMPDFHKKLWEESALKVAKELSSIMDAEPKDVPDIDLTDALAGDRDPKTLIASLILFTSYQEMQMDTFQMELQHLYRAFYELSQSINKTELN